MVGIEKEGSGSKAEKNACWINNDSVFIFVAEGECFF